MVKHEITLVLWYICIKIKKVDYACKLMLYIYNAVHNDSL